MQEMILELQSSLDKALLLLPQQELSADTNADSAVASIRTLIIKIGRAMGEQGAHEEMMMRQSQFLLRSAQPGDDVAVECWASFEVELGDAGAGGS